MKAILYLIYQFLKLLVKSAYRVFFSKSTVINPERFNISKPCILISNHPSTLIDPLNVAKHVPATVFFLANASLFKHPFVDKLLNTFYCIPVERPQDVSDRRISNEDNFKRADEFLSNGGVLYIAPEGTSVMEKGLRRVKTGTARIALSAESKNDFKLGLNILPVGLTYSSPTEFRSKTILYAGEPILIADYAELYKKDSREAVKALTADLQEYLGTLIYNTENDEEEALVDKVEILLNNENPMSEEAQFFRSKEMIVVLRAWKAKKPLDFQQFKEALENYFSELQEAETNDLAILNQERSKNKIANLVKLIIGFPFFVYGWFNNILPCLFPAYLAKKLKLYIGYKSTVKMLAGIISFPIFYGLQIYLVQQIFDNALLTWIYAFSLLPLGWFAWEFLEFVKQQVKNNRAAKLEDKVKLLTLRKSLIATLDASKSMVALPLKH